MPKCLIKGCTTKRIRGQRTGDTIMHSFPGSPARVRRWLESTGQHFDNLKELIDRIVATKKTSNYRICSRHFSPTCYEMIGSRKVLKENALPTICPQVDQAPPTVATSEPVLQISSSDDETGSNLDKQVAQSKKDHNYAYIVKPYEIVPFVHGVPEDEQEPPQVVEAPPMTKSIFSQTSAVITRNSATQTSKLFVKRAAIKCRSSSTTTRGLIKCKDACTSTGSYEEFLAEIDKYQKIFSKMEELKRSFSDEKTENLPGTSTPLRRADDVKTHGPSDTGVLPVRTKNVTDIRQKTDIVYAAPDMSVISYQCQEPMVEEPSYPEEKLSSDDTSTDEYEGSYVMERKFLIFESCLDKLLTFVQCQHESGCTATMIRKKKCISGTCLTVVGECVRGHTTTMWQSQPYISSIPAGDALTSAAILLSGNNYQKVKEYFRILRVPFISSLTYATYQRKYFFPAIDHSWIKEKRSIRDSLIGRPVCLTGDGHRDSPGFSAKYCTYTFVEEKSKKIVDFSVTRVSDTTSSVALEKKAFRRTLNNILNDGIEVLYIATDRHPGIQKIMREEYSAIEHQFDLWHYAKTLNKKLCALARKKNNKALVPWISTIIRYFWFINEYCKGNVFLLKELWSSTVYHVSNCHSWEKGKYVKKCLHEDLSEEEIKQRPWIPRHSNTLRDLSLLVHDKRIQKDLHHLGECSRAGGIDVFHRSVLKHRPKGILFKMDDLVARTKLAVLAHNCNVDRPQEAAKHPTNQMIPVGLQKLGPNSKMKEEWNVEKLYEASSTDHIDPILDDIIGRLSGEIKENCLSRYDMPPPNTAWANCSKASSVGWRPSSSFKRLRMIDDLGHTSYLSHQQCNTPS